jgi:hypothetical protein
MRDLSPNPWKPMKRACDQVDHQEQQDRFEPQRVIHIEETEKVQHLVEARSISLNIFRTGGILCNHRADDGKDGKKNEEGNGKFKRPKKVINEGNKSTFLGFHCVFRFFQRIL